MNKPNHLTSALRGCTLAALMTITPYSPAFANSTSSATDPLESVQWAYMKKAFLGDKPVVFDDRIKVLAPDSAENSLEVPVFVDASALKNVKQLLLFADLNPLPLILEYFPSDKVKPTLGFRFKVQQTTPVRVAALTEDGTWHVAGRWIDAAGGGCTLPSLASGNQAWATRLGEVNGRVWERDEGQRMRFSVLHPMDTGLASGIPVFHVSEVEVKDENGDVIALLKPYEPVSENPVFTLDIKGKGKISVDGRDNNGNRFKAELSKQ